MAQDLLNSFACCRERRSITDAAVASGFSDASHFNHVFKEMIE